MEKKQKKQKALITTLEVKTVTENERKIYNILSDYQDRGSYTMTSRFAYEELAKQIVESLSLPCVSGSATLLPSGAYVVGVDKAKEGSEDMSCRTWSQVDENGNINVLAVEHYR